MTSTIPDPTVGPPPPFDAELLAALEMASERLAEMASFGIEDIPALRVAQADLMRVSEADLHRDGAFTVSERVVPGPAGEPDISMLVCLPARATAPVAAIYHIHGGGMILGSAELHVWPGAFHGFARYAPQAALAQASRVPMPLWLRRVIGS
jgi:acetyl esterase/lipase